jgi:hypothetical protein
MRRAKLLDCRAIRLTTGDIPVATEVFLQNLEPFTLQSLRRAVEQGLGPSGLDFTDDDSIVVLRFTQPVSNNRTNYVDDSDPRKDSQPS